MMISPGQEGLPCRRTQGRGVKSREFQTKIGESFGDRGVARTSKGTRCSEPDVIQQDDEDVRSTSRGSKGLDRRKIGIGIFRVVGRETDVRPIRNWENRPRILEHRVPSSTVSCPSEQVTWFEATSMTAGVPMLVTGVAGAAISTSCRSDR
jgi:hypothetical protein